MSLQAPFNLNTWIEEHRDLLRPPVGNAKVFEDGDFVGKKLELIHPQFMFEVETLYVCFFSNHG